MGTQQLVHLCFHQFGRQQTEYSLVLVQRTLFWDQKRYDRSHRYVQRIKDQSVKKFTLDEAKDALEALFAKAFQIDVSILDR